MPTDICTTLHNTYDNLAQTVYDANSELDVETINFETINARWEYLHNMAQVNKIIKAHEALATILFLLGHLNVTILKLNEDSEYETAYDCLHRSVNMLMILCIKECRPSHTRHQIKEELELITEYWLLNGFTTEE